MEATLVGDGATKTYQSSADRLFEAVLRTVASLNYSVQHTDRVVRTVSFNTGASLRSFAGQDMTAIIFSTDGDAGSSLTLSGRRAQRLWQMVDWGELGSIQRKFLKRLETILPSVPEPAPQPTLVVAGSGQTVEARLATLDRYLSSGAINQEEFAAQRNEILDESAVPSSEEKVNASPAS